MSYGPLTLSIDAGQTAPFNSDDLETGNADKGLSSGTGAGQGDWRLALSSELDIKVLSYIRTTDGFLTSMHDVAPVAEGIHRIAIFNPGSNDRQVSRLRLINLGEEEAAVTIEGVDDGGMSPGGAVQLTVAAGATTTLTAADLESGGTGLTGALGNGTGKWRLTVSAEGSLHAMSLLKSPTGHLTNLSTAPSLEEDGVHAVSMFPSASDATLQGFVRVRNRGDTAAQVTVQAYDDTDWEYEPLTLTVAAGAVAPFNSNDLEQGNADKGLTGSTGAGEGDWRLELSSDSDIEVLSYIRTTDGFLTAMHDAAPVSGTQHRVAIFNPGSNDRQVSWLRMVNAGQEAAAVTITGIDDSGASPGSAVQVSVPAGTARAYTAAELESGGEGLEGALGDGVGKWRLEVASDQPIRVLSLLSSPTGHLTNLSTATERGSGVETAEEVFGTLISSIVQSQCINCHVEGGASGNTRLVFVTDHNPDHAAINLRVFEDLLDHEEAGTGYILNKIQGALGHGGGIQVAAGTVEYANMERFLSLLSEDVGSATITPATLFDGVKMDSARSTLRRAAIIFAGRIPTDEEHESIRSGGVAALRAAIRGMMEGPEFHEFLIRASNDRLLTDREIQNFPQRSVIDAAVTDDFVDLANRYHEMVTNGEDTLDWENNVQYGFGRAPLELIAYVARNELPYTEILTADYIMANPPAAEAYGSATVFDSPDDVHEFKPSRIVSYYRDDASKVSEYSLSTGTHVSDPGNLKTDYPHAGILNTTVFLKRYPTTATNRNRARSRWTYYHFLGLDIEKSASRTTDPVALADTDNPTLRNPACTVCHRVLDPVAGTFQNYGDEGFYRDQWGGLDSLDKHDRPSDKFVIGATSWEERETISITDWLAPDDSIMFSVPEGEWVALDQLTVRNAMDGEAVFSVEFEDPDAGVRWPREEWADCGYVRYNEETGESDHWRLYCPIEVPLRVPEAGTYEIEVVVWAHGSGARLATTTTFYRDGDTWYRDMRKPGFDGEPAPNAENSLEWLAERIVADDRFSESTVKFWWPSIMGSNILNPPAVASEAGFESRLLASSAQATEVARLARGFTRGFYGRSPHDLKDLLVEIVLSPWFRADAISDEHPVRLDALNAAGAKRLLTPEELARKTSALLGFQWGRLSRVDSKPVHTHRLSWLSDTGSGYGLMYGGIDSDGVTVRARDLTPMMTGVAQSHALQSSCPTVMREFYLLPDGKRRLFGGLDVVHSPTYAFGDTFEISAASRGEIETLTLTGDLPAGENTVTLAHKNAFFGDEGHGHRGILLDRLVVRRGEETVYEYELEELDHPVDCHHFEQGAFHLSNGGGECTLAVPIYIPADGNYSVELFAWADRAGNQLARLAVVVESDEERSAGSVTIKQKLVELYDKLHGVQMSVTSPEVLTTYDFFVDVWKRNRDSKPTYLDDIRLDCYWSNDHQFLDGFVDGAVVWRDDWGGYGWDFDRIDAYFSEVDWSDTHGVARTWSVMLAYLMMDYRYLHL